MSRETKSFPFSVKAVDDEQGLIEAYGSVFEVEDQGGDVVRPGAFKRTIQNSKARVQAGKATFLAVMLWQHNPDTPIGGWTDLKEDKHGLLCKGQIVLTTQQGKEAYELIKAGVVNEFSIGYDIPSGGANYDSKDGTRNLTELRLWEVSPVTFAMNEEALLVGVKSASGKTSFPLMDLKTEWTGSKAEKQIFAWAKNADGEIQASKAKQCFLWYNPDDSDKQSGYKMPFCYIVDGSPKIVPLGVRACANVLAGGMGGGKFGGDDGAMKSKVKTMIGRINSQLKPDPAWDVPWEKSEDGKGNHMNRQMKTLLEHFNEETAEDLLEDWQDVYVCALTCAVLDALTIGDQPEADISKALDDFKELVLSKFVAQAVECDLSGWLEEHSYSSSSGEYLMQYGSDSKPNYGYMSRSRPLGRKDGRAISAANAGKIQDHADALHAMADDHMKAVKAHVKALHAAADTMAAMSSGSDDGNDDKPDDSQDGKHRGTPSHKTRTTQARPPDDGTVNEDEIAAALGTLRALHA